MPNRVLIVDDDEVLRRSMQRTIKPLGCQVFLARSGPEAVQMTKRHRPHLLVVDIAIPGMDGWEAVSKIREDPRLADVPVVVVSSKTGFWQEQVMRRLMRVKGYFRKPLDHEAFLECVRKQLGIKD